MTASDVVFVFIAQTTGDLISPRDEEKNSPEARSGAARAVTTARAVVVNFIFSSEKANKQQFDGNKRTAEPMVAASGEQSALRSSLSVGSEHDGKPLQKSPAMPNR